MTRFDDVSLDASGRNDAKAPAPAAAPYEGPWDAPSTDYKEPRLDEDTLEKAKERMLKRAREAYGK